MSWSGSRPDDGMKNASVTGLEPSAGVINCEVSMQQHKPIVNDHFKAAIRMAHHLPHLITKQVKRAQQKAILRELIAGLKYGLPPTKNCGSLVVSD